ncbi:2-dehydropantoate 2-reductase [Polynucleobacter sphagniphilus]|jgi:2-dehydropantoate 2-reductase|uniref:2-dehydropantoate 2-reductase n=1 Tax=Polynucleobacter sphagniphilus TaxID=1743169 RepID=UPI00096B9DB1|nr:2-dehydropantoate 2-reductase [Polynucleobacter sphagniphilus]MDH6153924.1 2-dehydropantoate 2-reductase [Polynucleobacter sphagniphilus]MDH6242102.1 2-dehydropantoate 2-reductase [Polynucleobacter sphagniphilus]MDH6298980.1 2-dehydropantoate 2-reductase [Polynucleobacter sphagniphilus]MDH6302000.1 2-dehydropantoate 2-reductase [Polynucleobacter sphagniphilus]MDH6421044.1 2-dehydropantoate 2-reductase [Polynucleobacter sphagniphilus]
MKICVIGGGGAIGGYLAVMLSRAGNDVTVVARGATLAAIKERGLTLIHDEHPEPLVAKVKAVEKITDVETPDVVILAVKAHQVDPIIHDLAAIVGPETILIPMQNGIPWWYFQKLSGEYQDHTVETVDAGGVAKKAINPDNIIGCVVYPATFSEAPGVIRLVEGNRFPLGELNGEVTERVQKMSEMMTQAGFKSPVLEDIRSEIWLKLWGNMTFNPISALTHGTLEGICQFPLTRDLARNMMAEAQAIAGKLGVTFRVDIERRIAGAEKVGKHKTSMLQDLEAGRSLEVDALLGSVIELGKITNTPTPCLNTVFALTKYLDENIQATGGSLALPPVGDCYALN